MAVLAPSFIQVHPSYVMPELLMPYTQASGAFDALPTGAPLTRLSEGDLYAYIKRIELRTTMEAGQSAPNQLPGVSFAFSQISAPTYLLRCRAQWDHHDTAAVSKWGVGIADLHRLGMRQANFQLQRNGLLYGFNPVNGEGLVNAVGATSIPLPPDGNGNDTVVTYDNGEMAFFLLSQISALKTRTNQLGIGRKFVVLGPQRTLGQMEYQNIVMLTQFQSKGGGSTSTAGVFKDVLSMNDDDVIWAYDDTLIGKGAGGNDAVLIVMPEVEQPKGRNTINTNEFAKLGPSLEANLLMLNDMVAPREIPTPLAGGAIDVVQEMRTTAGWALRPECVTIISMQYE
jgi:hypothetical protein